MFTFSAYLKEIFLGDKTCQRWIVLENLHLKGKIRYFTIADFLKCMFQEGAGCQEPMQS